MVEIPENEIDHLLNVFYEGVCYLNAQGEIQYTNAAARSHWEIEQHKKRAMTGQSVVMRALAGEEVRHELMQISREKSLFVNAMPLLTENSVRGVIVTSQDVSEHVTLEQSARKALDIFIEAMMDTASVTDVNESLRRIATLLPQLLYIDNSIAFRVNEQTGKISFIGMFGSSEQNEKEWQQELSALVYNTQMAVNEESLPYLQALRMMRAIKVEFSTNGKNNNPRNLRAAIYAPVVIDGHVVGLLGVERHRPLGQSETYFPQWSIDLLTALARLASMTYEKQLLHASEEQLKNEGAALRALLDRKEEFLLLATHELKNPLTAILGQAQVLHRRISRTIQHGSDQQAHELVRGLESIEHQTRRISHMINTLMEVSRVDLDRMELDVQDVDLLQMVRRTLKDNLPLAPQHEMVLFVNGKSIPILKDDEEVDVAVHVRGDEHRLEQVVNNLISNAIKYSPNGGPITVTLKQTSNNVELKVEDRGIGIPPEERARLTERFYRAENAQATTSKGLGIGLYLVNTLIQQHGGTITIASEGIPGKGSIFSVTLPAQNA